MAARPASSHCVERLVTQLSRERHRLRGRRLPRCQTQGDRGRSGTERAPDWRTKGSRKHRVAVLARKTDSDAMCWQSKGRNRASLPPDSVNRTPMNTACTGAHSVPQHILNRLTTFPHANTRGSRARRLRIAHLCVLKQWSSMCHVSFFASLDTDHKHKFSLTFLTNLSDSLTNTQQFFGRRSILTLGSSTAEWRINTNPISHRL